MRVLLTAVLCPALLLVGCDPGDLGETFPVRSPASSPTSGTGPVIGLVGTMSGPDSWRGEDAFEGADLAVHVLNQSLGERDPRFDLVTLDDEGDPARAEELIGQLAESERTVGIVYAGPTETLGTIEEVLAASDVPLFVCYGDPYSARALTPHLFQMSTPLLWQARRIAPYLLRDRGYRRVGLLTGRDPDAVTARTSLTSALRALGGDGPLVARYEGDEDIASALESLLERKVEAVVFHGPARSFRLLLQEAKASDAEYLSTERARTSSVKGRKDRRKARRRVARPQIIAFDEALGTLGTATTGTVASDTYARGSHYLPVPSFKRFRKSFRAWWDAEPLGWERRSYEAARLIGWAAMRARGDEDLIGRLETLRGKRFGGLGITFGPDDHTSVDQTTVGLWVLPRSDLGIRERARLPEGMPWVPLGRGFSIDGDRTDVLPQDWRYLFRNPPPEDGPGPRITSGRFGVVTTKKDPIH